MLRQQLPGGDANYHQLFLFMFLSSFMYLCNSALGALQEGKKILKFYEATHFQRDEFSTMLRFLTGDRNI